MTALPARLPTPRTAEPVSDRARGLTEHAFDCAAAKDFHRAAVRVDEVLEQVTAEAYERGLAAGRREHVA